MISVIRKIGQNYYLGNEQHPLPENASIVLPNLQQPSGEFLWLLLKALLDVDRRCYRNPDEGANQMNLELDFYSHISSLWEVSAQRIDDRLMVNSDLVKVIPDEVKPDLVLNERYGDRQLIAAEFKRNVYSTNSERIFRDFGKLNRITLGYYSEENHRNVIGGRYMPYDMGAFVLICGTFEDLKHKLDDKVEDLRTFVNETLGERRSRIFCICSPGDGTLEYSTIEDLLLDM
jgi:hypothetical protein